MTAEQFVRQLNLWGVRFVEVPGWRTRNRTAPDRAWGPAQGVLLHHTGDDAPDDADVRVLTSGRPDLVGPLCHWAMRDDGVAVLIGWGRANHAGKGAANVLAAVTAEGYDRYPPKPGPDTIDGNAHFYGQETCYSGGTTPTAAAYAATVRIFAAVCHWHGWSARSCIGHKEWTGRKVDPGSLDMATFRHDVQAALDARAGVTTDPEGADMSDADVAKILAGVKTLIAGEGTVYTKDTEPDPSLRQANLAEIGIVAARHGYNAENVARALSAKVDALGAAVARLAAAQPDVDEAAVARELAPLLVAQVPVLAGHMATEDIQAIADALGDELSRRLAS